jgi:hypothetical protein
MRGDGKKEKYTEEKEKQLTEIKKTNLNASFGVMQVGQQVRGILCVRNRDQEAT